MVCNGTISGYPTKNWDLGMKYNVHICYYSYLHNTGHYGIIYFQGYKHMVHLLHLLILYIIIYYCMHWNDFKLSLKLLGPWHEIQCTHL